jgi:2-polyprenyl-3-methyl-5-hydroxy-6-metoxy-1,4-benzoquinol methylase
LDAYYSAQYRRDYHGEVSPSAHRVMRAWHCARWLIRLLRPYLPPSGRVCEIGAGIGCTVKALEWAGYQASGIEPGLGFHRFAQHSLRADVTRRSLAQLPPVPCYDLVLLVHVIEHFNSPRRALQQIRQLLRPGGHLVDAGTKQRISRR